MIQNMDKKYNFLIRCFTINKMLAQQLTFGKTFAIITAKYNKECAVMNCYVLGRTDLADLLLITQDNPFTVSSYWTIEDKFKGNLFVSNR